MTLTVAQMRDALGLDPSTPDIEVVDAWAHALYGSATAEEPLSLDQAKQHLGVTEDDDDGRIADLIVAAREYAEAQTGLALTARAETEQFDHLGDWIELSRRPVRAITSISYPDTSGIDQTLDPTSYRTVADRFRVRVLPSITTRWPRARRSVGGVQVVYDAGFPTPDEVPQSIKQAMRLMIRHWFDNPAAVVAGSTAAAVEVPLGVEALLRSFKRRRL